MITPKLKTCKECGKECYLFSKGRCKACASKSYGKPKTKVKNTGQIELFDRIFLERGGVCQISGEQLKPKGHPDYHFQFAHVLGKGAYPKFKLYEKNIVLMTKQNHLRQTAQEKRLRDNPDWQWYWKLFDELKKEYFE